MQKAHHSSEDRETVVLLHGILKNKFDMARIERGLKRQGYDTINLSYPSNRMPLEDLRKFVKEKLDATPAFNNAVKVHFVTHSMGGLITRYYLHENRPENLGRVVMLSPPNKGSEFADFMSETAFLKDMYARLFGPAGKQLQTKYKHAAEDHVDFPLGIIGGKSSINPLAPWVLGADSSHDGIVPIERMKIEGMTDIIILPATHTFMVFNTKVRDQVIHFLKHEKFDHRP